MSILYDEFLKLIVLQQKDVSSVPEHKLCCRTFYVGVWADPTFHPLQVCKARVL